MKLSEMLSNALVNNDTCLRLLGDGPLDTRVEPGALLYRACRWHVGNGDAAWQDEDQIVCAITEQGRKTLAHREWERANPEEAERRTEAFFAAIEADNRQRGLEPLPSWLTRDGKPS